LTVAELRCEGLAKRYRARPVLRGVDLAVAAGTLTAVLGASGSGKTTLLRVIMGFLEVDAGRVTVGGAVVAEAGRVHLPPDKRAIGYMAQEGALFPHLTAGENVGFGLPRSERKRGYRVAEVLELVGLAGSCAGRRPHELSGGEQRRVALARALAPRPRLVLLDEPFSGLDAALRVETREAVLRALACEGTTALMVTHDQAEALSMGRQVAVLRDGLLVQRAAPETLYRQPADPEVALFVGEAVLVPGICGDGRVACALGELGVAGATPAGPVLVMVRPEQIRLARPGGGPPGDSGRAILAQMLGSTYYGPQSVARLALDAPGRPVVRARIMGQDVPAPGDPVELTVSGDVAVFPAPGSAFAGPAFVGGPAGCGEGGSRRPLTQRQGT
jgi:iron(III) transport system ATP-binding protein